MTTALNPSAIVGRAVLQVIGGALVICSFGACASTVGTTSSKASVGPPAIYYPKGVDKRFSLHGVSADSWTSRRVTFNVTVPIRARDITIDIDNPGYGIKPYEQGVTMRVGNGPDLSKHKLPIGHQILSFPLLPVMRGHVAVVVLSFDKTFVPAKIGLNGDARELAVKLYGVSFR